MSALTAADIILRPVISEKSIDVSTLGDRDAKAGNKYTFAVHRDANKIQIKRAVEQLFQKKVVNVNTSNYAGKKKRERTMNYGRKAHWKKAIVTLKEGDKIELV